MTIDTARTTALFFALLLALGPAVACSSGGGSTDPVDVEALRPLIGTWRAEALVHTSKTNPETTLDIIAEGGSFTFEVTEEGRYAARLTFIIPFDPEVGRITVNGSMLSLMPDGTGGRIDEAEWRIEEGVLFITADSRFDFTGDGESVPTTLDIRLNRI